MGVLGKILSFNYNSAEAVKEVVLKTDFYSIRLLKEAGHVNPTQDSSITNILLNGKCIDKETRCLYLFYIDTFFSSAWILEVQIDTRSVTVVYFDRYNDIGFHPLRKIYNPRVVHGKLIWTDNLNPVYQMDIARAKRSFSYGIGYDPFPATTEWNAVRTYQVSEIVSYGSAFYKSLQVNSGVTPGQSSATWQYLCLLVDAYYSMNVENFYFAAKPPEHPPVVNYVSDANRNINNLKQTLFQFAYNYIYIDYRESTYSPACVVAMPQSEEEVATGLANEDISHNNTLNIRVNTGGEEVRKIRIIGRSNQDPSKWFVVGEISKFEETEEVQLAKSSGSGLSNTERQTITISVPTPIVTGTSLTLSEYETLTLSVNDPTASNHYIEASIDDMYWEWYEYI